MGAVLSIVCLKGNYMMLGTSLNNYSQHCLCVCVSGREDLSMCVYVFPKSSFILNTPLGTIGRTYVMGSDLCNKQVKSLSVQSNMNPI